jgi:heat shock protein HslJ
LKNNLPHKGNAMKQCMIWVGILVVLAACSHPNATATVVPTIIPPAQIVSTESIDTPVPDATGQIEGVTWQLRTLNDKPITQTPAPTIQFSNMLTIAGDAFCNSYSGIIKARPHHS